jgi:hypothetical protein
MQEINKDKDGIQNLIVQLSSGNQVASHSMHNLELFPSVAMCSRREVDHYTSPSAKVQNAFMLLA